jgi:DNA-directed RNA polymerase subunit M/transcription elongation factor TFIIS
MEFCKVCDNMLFLNMANDMLTHRCRKCKNEEDINVEHYVVSKTNYKRSEQKYESIVNEYTKLDVTLPRVRNIPCPNEACDPTDTNIIYIRYDDTEMLFLYLCRKCGTKWNTNKN